MILDSHEFSHYSECRLRTSNPGQQYRRGQGCTTPSPFPSTYTLKALKMLVFSTFRLLCLDGPTNGRTTPLYSVASPRLNSHVNWENYKKYSKFPQNSRLGGQA